jgi:hypothetical protein
MVKLFSFLAISTITIYSCNNQDVVNSNKLNSAKLTGNSIKNNLVGKWERADRRGFTAIEIKDTAHAFIYIMNSKSHSSDTLSGTMGFFNDKTIWIHIPTARFDYRIVADTLIEFDKVGTQGVFIKKQE